MKQIKRTIFLCLLCMIGIGVHAEEIPNNEIWYTSSDGKVVTPNKSDVFGASIISNTYSNGKGVIKFDNSVTSIGWQAFYYCSGLTSITIPNSVTSIGMSAFYDCSGLTSITIPNSVTSIGDGAFEECTGLSSITIPNSVTSIGSAAFYGCDGLTSITIPNSVTSIGMWAFNGCSGLTSITVESGNPKYDSRDNCNAIIETRTNTLIAGCKNTITPNSVTSIGDAAFYYCTGLTSITIPNSVTSIGYEAFFGCSGLTSITIPNSVTSIGDCAFGRTENVTTITVDKMNQFYDSRDNCKAIIETRTNTLIAGCKNTITPNSVTSIGDDAFYGCTGLKSITIPNSVTSIGDEAFEYCYGLTSITIPNSVTSIGNWAFENCYFSSFVNNSSLDAESNNYWDAKICNNDGLVIEDNIIVDCAKWVTSINIPNSVTSIGDWAFNGCSGLTSITVESGNPKYDSRDNCNAIIETRTNTLIAGCKNTITPNSVTSIGDAAFYGCSGLTSITIPNSVTSIGDGAFEECTGLTSITIPNSVKSIGDWAFCGCSGLTSIFVSWSRPLSIRTYTFENIDKTNCILYVPKGTSTLYKPAPVWEDFQNIQEYEDEEFLANKKAFEEYKNAEKADAENLAKKGDSQAVLTLITNAKSAIDTLTYDESLSLDDNKKAVDAIITKLESDVKAQREAEELWANKLAFNTYRNSRKSDADALAKPDDSQEILAIITRAKEEIEGLEYDQSKSLSDNMAAVDAIIRQLKTDLENARIAAGMNGIITSDGNLQIHTLDGRKVDSIGKSGFYIINGVKKYVNGNCK